MVWAVTRSAACIDIAAIEQVYPGARAPLPSPVEWLGPMTILRGRWRRHDLRDEIWVLDVTGLGEVHLIAHPMSVPLTAIARLEVIGRGDACR